MSEHVPLTLEERRQLTELKNETLGQIAEIKEGIADAATVAARGPALLAQAQVRLEWIEQRLLENFCMGDSERADAIRVHQTRSAPASGRTRAPRLRRS